MKNITTFCLIMFLFSFFSLNCLAQDNKKEISKDEYLEILNQDQSKLIDKASSKYVHEQYDVLVLYSGRLLELRESLLINNLSLLTENYVKEIAQKIWVEDAIRILNKNNLSIRNNFNELLIFSGMWILICEKLDINPYIRAVSN